MYFIAPSSSRTATGRSGIDAAHATPPELPPVILTANLHSRDEEIRPRSGFRLAFRWAGMTKFCKLIHASQTSAIILLAAFDTGTSSGVVLRMKADGELLRVVDEAARMGGCIQGFPLGTL